MSLSGSATNCAHIERSILFLKNPWNYRGWKANSWNIKGPISQVQSQKKSVNQLRTGSDHPATSPVPGTSMESMLMMLLLLKTLLDTGELGVHVPIPWAEEIIERRTKLKQESRWGSCHVWERIVSTKSGSLLEFSGSGWWLPRWEL